MYSSLHVYNYQHTHHSSQSSPRPKNINSVSNVIRLLTLQTEENWLLIAYQLRLTKLQGKLFDNKHHKYKSGSMISISNGILKGSKILFCIILTKNFKNSFC